MPLEINFNNFIMGICLFRPKQVAKYPYFILDFIKINFQLKTRFLENRVIGKKLLKKNLNGNRVPCNILQVTRFSLTRVFH